MTAGRGRVQRAVRAFITERIAAADGMICIITTDHLCEAAFQTDVITKSQRVAVLRVMKHMWQNNRTLNGLPPNLCLRSSNRREWKIAQIDEEYVASPKAAKAPRRRSSSKLAAIIRMLRSNQQGERDAAVLALQRKMTADGLDWDDLAAAVESKFADP